MIGRKGIKFYILLLGIYLVYWYILFCLLWRHVVSDDGPCAARYFYIPLTHWDRGLFILLGLISGLLVCYWLYRRNYRKKVFLAITFMAFVIPAIHYAFNGNNVMASHKEYWPNEYYLQPVGTIYAY